MNATGEFVILLGRDRTRTFDGVRYVVVQSPLTKAHRRRLNRYHAVQVEQVNPPVRDLGWLTPWAGRVERLLITDYSITDISALEGFAGLECLALYTGKLRGRGNRIAFDRFPRLRSFAAFWFPVLEGVFGSRTVEDLYLERPPSYVFERCAEMPALRKLDLGGARKVARIPRLSEPSRIRHLRIAIGRFEDVHGLVSYPNIESLELCDVSGVRDLSVLRGMSRLRRLVLEDCGEIETLAFLADMPIEELFLIGTTNILDGELRVIGAGLRGVHFPVRAHYDATPDDLK